MKKDLVDSETIGRPEGLEEAWLAQLHESSMGNDEPSLANKGIDNV